MNFFGGNNCGDSVQNECGGGMDCCSIIFLLLLLQNCGCGGFSKCGINLDCKTILLLLILSKCGFTGNSCN